MVGRLMYLVDSNLLLELMLDQEKAEEIEQFMRTVSTKDIYLSEFSLYSIGIVLLRRKMYDAFMRFVEDLLMNGGSSISSTFSGKYAEYCRYISKV